MDRDRPERFERPPVAAPEVRSIEPRPERPERLDRPERAERPERPEGSPLPRRRERPAGDRLPAEAHEQPEFLRRPVRRPRRDDQDDAAVSAPVPAVAATEDSD